MWSLLVILFFFFNDTATTEIYTLSLHDALPISPAGVGRVRRGRGSPGGGHALERSRGSAALGTGSGLCELPRRSEEHTSELQSRQYLVCRLLLEKKQPHA